MKKLIIVLLFLLLVFPIISFADGTVVEATVVNIGEDRLNSNPIRTITFTCTGDAVNGSIPDTTMTVANFEKIKGWCLRGVEAYPTSGGIAPDAASVFVLDGASGTGLDLLGSEDNGTTAYAGLNLIHATLKRACLPNLYLVRAGLHVNYYPLIKNRLVIKVIDQGTASANWTIVLIFSR